MEIRQSFKVSAPRQRVAEHLLDVERVAACVPGAGEVERADDGSYQAKLSMQLGPIRSSFAGSVRVDDAEAPDRLRASARGRDRGSGSQASIDMVADLVEGEDGQTEVQVVAEVVIRGRLGQFGTGVIQGTAAEMTQAFAACLRSQVEAAPSSDGADGQPLPPPEAASPPSLLALLARSLRSLVRERWRRLRGRAQSDADAPQ